MCFDMGLKYDPQCKMVQHDWVCIVKVGTRRYVPTPSVNEMGRNNPTVWPRLINKCGSLCFKKITILVIYSGCRTR